MRKILYTLIITCITLPLFAEEGMWIPTLLKKYNIAEMQKLGFKLSAEDVYDINNSSLKDAVVLFGGGCTGEVISDRGLLITNHHCGYGQIQYHSSVENDYLTDGFWAMSQEEELVNQGLTVKFLVRMENVTDRVFAGTAEIKDEMAQAQKILDNIAEIEKSSIEGTHYVSNVKPIFAGNQYYLHVYEEFLDVRLVGAPPSAIGKFGGDTDNWMWPRHTGDFSIFRIYANKDNKPAKYSEDNIPYTPKHSFPINIGGIEEGDFTMVFGFPGSTREYLPSQALDLIINQSNPECVSIRTAKLDILSAKMEADRKVRIQYASKYARTSNSWKRWKGEIKGLNRLDAINKKRAQEELFQEWTANNSEYSDILKQFADQYQNFAPYQHSYDFYNEVVSRGTDIISLAKLLTSSKSKPSKIDLYFKNYDLDTDREVFIDLFTLYIENMENSSLPEEFQKLKAQPNTIKEKLNKLYLSSSLTDKSKLNKLKSIEKDPIIKLYRELTAIYKDKIYPEYNAINSKIEKIQKLYMKAITEMKEGEKLMADANLTLRVTYGKVEGYKPADGVVYKHYTTVDGIIAKDNPEIYDYNVPERFRELYKLKDYGAYTNREGTVPVAFCASNHTTGGNSGSPVIDANGNLIGVNFDRCWEGTMSDLMFDPARCRNIALDMRYALFIIDKFAGASYLIKEMSLVK